MMVQLETFGERPFLDMPGGLKTELMDFKPTVTFFTAIPQDGEITFRRQLILELLPLLKVSHAHMSNITEEIMLTGMCADYQKVFEMNERVAALLTTPKEIEGVVRLVSKVKRMEVTTKAGTNITVEFSPDFWWVNSNGQHHGRGKFEWSNLPDGEFFTCPWIVNGTLVVDGVLGDCFDINYGLLGKTPVTITIKDSIVTSVSCRNNPALEKELKAYLARGENSDRACEFGIGTNNGIAELIGNILQDEKILGTIHLAFGDPGKKVNVSWSAKTHIDCVIVKPTIIADGNMIMRQGAFLI
jgi:leucyl aminopeptidase (aminopeptidase T)